jgi:hypothetical protein
MSNGSSTPESPLDELDASLQSIMERLRRQAEEIAQLRRDLDKVRSSTPIVTPPRGVDPPATKRGDDDADEV